MNIPIKAHPTIYNGVRFRSRLEARWAAFFDLIGWDWKYEPLDLKGWVPDFLVTFSCDHSECHGSHSLLVEVKPFFSIDEFAGHPCMDFSYGCKGDMEWIPADSSAAFGIDPTVSWWEMGHGAGGGSFEIEFWVRGATDAWKTAGNIVQWKPRQRPIKRRRERYAK